MALDISAWGVLLNVIVNTLRFVKSVWDRLRGRRSHQMIPQTAIVALPRQERLLMWHKGERGDQEVMMVVGDFYFTNASTLPVLIPNAHLIAYYRKWGVFPARKRVDGDVAVKDVRTVLHGHYPIPPNGTTSGRAHWTIEPPIKRSGQPLWASVIFTDAYGNQHQTKVLRWHYL